MIDISGFVAKASERCGFVRERFNDRNLPTDPANICVMPFFGDIRTLFVLSSLLLKRYVEQDKSSKYFILCSWPGFQGLFPYISEYWGIEDEALVRRLYPEAAQFRNKSDAVSGIYRNLNQFFFEDVVIPVDVFTNCYGHGIQDGFWQKYERIKRTLPLVPSSASLGRDFNKDLANKAGFKVFVYPCLTVQGWQFSDTVQAAVSKEFWVTLIKRLLKEGFVPVIYKGTLTHDISAEFTNQCIHVADKDISKVMAAMRATGCVLDVFSGISRIATAARTPFVSLDERARYAALKEYEVDDLCTKALPKQYIFTFHTTISSGGPETWDFNIINNVISRLHTFLPTLDRDVWPSTAESTEIVSYDNVRKKKSQRLGTKLIKTPREEDIDNG